MLSVVNFTSNISEGYVLLSVKFTDNSENAASVSWDFGDGTASKEADPIHTYFTAGTYTENLTVTNINGTDSKTAIINVLTLPPIINSITVPLNPVPVGTNIAANASVRYLGI